jgi:hypothetical protein
MERHRLLEWAPIVRLPRSPAPEPSPSGFMLCPMFVTGGFTLQQLAFQHCLYQWAFEQAREIVRPSLPERDLLGVWN